MQKRDGLDTLFKRMADDYIEKYGSELKDELDAMKGEPERLTPAMDEKVKRGRQAVSRARLTRGLGIAAAAVVAAVLLPVMISQISAQRAPVIEQYAAAPALETPAPDTAGKAAEEAIAPASEAAPESAEAPTAAPATGMAEPIPLSASLPPNFTVSAQEQDEGKTIYYIDNTEKDNVVLTMQYSDSLPDVSALKEVPINGQVAYGGYNPDFATLVFLKDGVLYELTSQYDINTLITLGESILV